MIPKTTSYNDASKCLASMSPYAVLQEYVTEALNTLNRGCNRQQDISREVIVEHYNEATENEQMERRKDYLVDV